MAGFFARLFGLAKSEGHALIDRLEDPIKMTEQGLRDLRKDLESSMHALAQVKSEYLRMKKDSDDQRRAADDFERKAMMLLTRVKNGELPAERGEPLASEALSKQQEHLERSKTLEQQYGNQQRMASQLQNKVNNLHQTIRKYENELLTLKARAKTAQSMRKINQHLAGVDSSSTINMLEKMKNRVSEEESLAEAYGEVGDSIKTTEQEIDEALNDSKNVGSQSLEELKKKMGLTNGG